jgi:hypothetical protein
MHELSYMPGSGVDCWRLHATAMYTSNLQATFRLSVGAYADIQAGRAASLTVQLPAQVSMNSASYSGMKY